MQRECAGWGQDLRFIPPMKKILYIAAAVAATAAFTISAKKNEIQQNLSIFNQLYKELNTFYVDSIDPEKSINTAIEAMLDDIDPYTEYIPEKEQENLHRKTTGEYAGIGSYIMQRDGDVFISGPNEGSPAQLAGLRPGDRIVVIDNDTVLGMKSDEVSKRLKGPAGTQVRVTVARPYVGADSVLTFDITRRKIQEPSVTWSGVVRDHLGYIYLSSYTDKSADEVRKALLEFKANPEVKGVVLDLRGNGGGLVDAAVKILGYFLPAHTEVIRTRGKGPLNEKIYKTSGQPIMPDMPLFVLIDGGTASSSEITAGALQDLDRAVIIGNRSFGKGLVQSTRELPYNNLLYVTVAKYYLPSGRLIQAIDYSRRNPDGSVARIPDSLANVFKTRHGREVRDGGGITPDVNITRPEGSRLVYNIVRDNWAFDYANRYRATHDTIAPALDFVITDSIYADFKRSIDPEKFEYDKVCEVMLERMRQTAETEGYMNDSTKAEFDVLAGLLKHDLQRDLDTHRKEIEPFLAGEIAERYYYQKGRVQSQLRDDPDLDKAAEILASQDYTTILSPSKTDKKKAK